MRHWVRPLAAGLAVLCASGQGLELLTVFRCLLWHGGGGGWNTLCYFLGFIACKGES